MKVAIPIFGPRVSPRFDFAPGLLLLTLEKGAIVDRREVSLGPLDLWQRVERLREFNIETLICGGIDAHSLSALAAHRIQVIPWVAGEAEEAMNYYLRGELKSGLNLCPGFGRSRRRRGRRALSAGSK